MEIWKPVPSHPLLEVSSHGRVRSRKYEQQMPNGGTRVRRLTPTFGTVSVSKKGSAHERMNLVFRRKNYRIARLVCEAFHGPPPDDKLVVIHLDEDAKNNRPDNLKWGTQKENLNAPGFIKYCKSRTGKNSTAAKHRAKMGARS